MNERTGGAILIDALKVNGVDLAFCVPGESYLEALDAFYDARDEDFPDAFERATRAQRPALLELAVDPELISTRATIASLRKRALSFRA